MKDKDISGETAVLLAQTISFYVSMQDVLISSDNEHQANNWNLITRQIAELAPGLLVFAQET